MRGVGVDVGCCRVGLVLCVGPAMATGRLDLVAAGGQRGVLCGRLIVTIGV